jgi:hypothetical protein
MTEELFKICPTVKRIGYRYRTFYIYAVQPLTLKEEKIRNNKIRMVLEKYEIFPFKIAQCGEKIQEFMHTGAKIEAKSSEQCISLRSKTVFKISKGGTLGGFVKTKEGNQQYCLLSKHVTEGFNDVYYVENGNEIIFGVMKPETNNHCEGGLDISAAVLNEQVGEESTKFKDIRGQPLMGRLHGYNVNEEDDICRSGQSVHIHGAVSKPGVGEITMPIVLSGLTSPLIQIEDIAIHSEHFAEKGDSGAVVCVEDPGRRQVHALGMVIGESSSARSRRTYLALPLSKGIKQIEEKTESQLELM